MRIFSGVARVMDLIPWTPLGLLVAVCAYAVLRWLAYGQLDLVLLVVGYAMAALGAICTLLVCAVAAALKLGSIRRPQDGGPSEGSQLDRRRLGGGQPQGGPQDGSRPQGSRPQSSLLLETGAPLQTGFSLPSLRWVPLIRLRWSWVQPAGPRVEPLARGHRLWEAVSMHDRGQFSGVTRRVVVEDVLGLCRVAVKMRGHLSFDVLPSLGGLRQTPQLRAMAGGDALPHPMGIAEGDRTELQRYVPGDPARFIHWKVFGRTRRLMVRMPERALSLSHRTAAFIAAGPNDDASAAVARLALERQLLGTDWRFGSDAEIGGTSQLDEALAVLMRSSGARDRAGTGLSAFLREVEKEGPAAALVFAPPKAGNWIPHLLDVARLRRIRVVIGTDGIAQHAPSPFWRRVVSILEPQAGTPAEELDQVLQALSSGNCDVTVMDRQTGRPLSREHMRVDSADM